MKHWKNVGRIFGILLVGALLAMGVFMGKTFRAGETALAALEDSATVEVEFGKDYVAFLPKEQKAEKAFLFYPGARVEYTAYAPILRALAEEGLLVYGFRMPQNFALLGISKAGSIIASHPEIKDWYLGGHSLGGVAAASYGKDHREISGLVLLASRSSENLGDLPVLAIHGSEDGVLKEEPYRKSLENLSSSVTVVEIAGGNHAQFGDYGFQSGDNPAFITKEEQWAITEKAILDFLLK